MTLETATMPAWHLRLKPRRWQETAVTKWKVDYHGVASVVTGGGKTVLAEMCMLAFRERFPQGRTLIVVPTITLLDQWVVSLQEELGVPKSEIGCYSGQEKGLQPRPVNVAVINTARKLAPTITAHADAFLIVDECHRAGSPVNSLALQISTKAALGLSATPERDYDDGFQEHVLPALGRIIYRYDYDQARVDGVVSSFELVNVKIDLLPDEQARYAKLTKRAAVEVRRLEREGGSDEKLKRILQARAAVSNTAAMRIPVAAKLVDEQRGKRTIVFHERIEAANAITNILSARKHCATVYHSRIGPPIRRDNLRLYRKGIFDVIVTCRALDEGMNVPETAVAIIASATASHRQRIQRLGRALRPARGKSLATIYTIYATDQEEQRLKHEENGVDGAPAVLWVRGIRKSHG